MAKIIKYGNKLTWYVGKQISCVNCDCLFQIEAGDTVSPYSDQRDGSGIKIKCPQCQRETWLSHPSSR